MRKSPEIHWLEEIFGASQATLFDNGVEAEPRIRFLGSGGATPWLSFAMPDFRHIVVAGTVNGVSAHVLLSPTLPSFLLDREFVTQLRRDGKNSGLKSARLAFGNLTLDMPRALLADMSAAKKILGARIDVGVGVDALNYLMLEINFIWRKLAFRRPVESYHLAGATELKLRASAAGSRNFLISLEGRPPIPAVFDLCADRALYLSPHYATEQKLLADRKVSTRHCHVVAPRTQEACFLHLIKQPQPPSAKFPSPRRESLGAFGRMSDVVER